MPCYVRLETVRKISVQVKMTHVKFRWNPYL